MIRFSEFALLSILLTACAPTAPNGPTPDSLPSVPDPFFTQLIDTARAASGQWFSRSDEGVHTACFGAPQSECQLSTTAAG